MIRGMLRAHRPAAALLSVLLGLAAGPAAAEEYTGHRLGASSQVVRKALQEMLHQPSRSRGQIYLAVPEASIMGLQTAYKPFCLPRVQIINSSNETVGELIFGIRYGIPGNGTAGSTITRISRLEVGREFFDEAFAETLRADTCHGMMGEVEIVRCVYQDGGDCTADVRPLAHGAVPLQLTAGAPLQPARALPPLRPGTLLQRIPAPKEEKK